MWKKECRRTFAKTNRQKKVGAYKYAKNGGLTITPRPSPKKLKPWEECNASERWEQMSLQELSKEIAEKFPGKSFGYVRLLKEQGKLPENFGLGCVQ